MVPVGVTGPGGHHRFQPRCPPSIESAILAFTADEGMRLELPPLSICRPRPLQSRPRGRRPFSPAPRAARPDSTCRCRLSSTRTRSCDGAGSSHCARLGASAMVTCSGTALVPSTCTCPCPSRRSSIPTAPCLPGPSSVCSASAAMLRRCTWLIEPPLARPSARPGARPLRATLCEFGRRPRWLREVRHRGAR